MLAGLAGGLAGCVGLGGDGDAPNEAGGSPPGTGEVTTEATTTEATTTTESPFPGYETTTVRVRASGGERLGAVEAAVADEPDLRYTGLSETASMPADWGMLFVFEGVAERTFVMRRMEFPLDMAFADADGVITAVREAPAPEPGEDGNDIERTGRAQYVLELNRGWSRARGVTAGDVLEFALP